MSPYLQKWILGIGSLFWIFWVTVMYLGYHPQHVLLFKDHPYVLLMVLTGAVCTGLFFYSQRRLKQKKAWLLPVRGVLLLGVFLLAGLVVFFQFRTAIELDSPPSGSAGLFYVLHSCWYLLLFLILGLALAATGHFFTRRIGLHKGSHLFDVAVGCCVGILISTLLGLLGLLYGAALGVFLLLFAFLERQYLLATFKHWLITKHQWKITTWWELPIALIGMLFLGIYWIGGIKAFATGFDGAALYANMAQLVAQHHGLPGAFQAYGWSVVMSWGELLFGSTTFSLLLSQAMYIPALLLAYQLVRKWLQPAYALVLIVLVLSLPMVSFQAMVDEKIDLGLLFISLAAIYQLFQWPEMANNKKSRINYFLLLGGLIGIAFSIKYTAIFLLIAVVGILFLRIGKERFFWAYVLIALGLLFLAGFYTWGNLPITVAEARIFGAVLGGVGLVLGALSFQQIQDGFKPFLHSLTALGIAFLLAFLPWGIKHLSEHQFELSFTNFLQGEPDRISMQIPPELLSGHHNQSPFEVGQKRSFVLLTSDQNTPEQQVDVDQEPSEEEKLEGNARREELQRYLGYEEGIWRYLSIPFDLTLNLNVSGLRHQEIGFLFLALLPLLFLFVGSGSWWRNSLLLGLAVFWLGSCFWSLTEEGTALAQQEAIASYQAGFWQKFPTIQDGIFHQLWLLVQAPFVALSAALAPLYNTIAAWGSLVYLPALVGIFFAMSIALKHKRKLWPSTLNELAAGLLVFSLTWFILGNAIVWYAMLLWVLLPLWLFFDLQQSAKKSPSFLSSPLMGSLVGITIGFQLFLNLGIVLSSSQPTQPAAYIYNWPMVKYLSDGSLTRDKTYRLFDAVSQDICNIINRDKNSKVYRVNTYLQYHIDGNDKRVYEDNQLQYFANVRNITNRETAFLDVLKANGIDYLIYDINTPSLDQTPEQSLRKKCDNLLRLLLGSERVEIVLTDNFVAAPDAPVVQLPNGQQAQARQGLIGQTVFQGRIVLFKIN